ncbi:MAG: pilus assembly protein CpaE [Actinomycetota bacterium]|nr:pilus assembly protein CpaE [Actinomycetota bacterium]
MVYSPRGGVGATTLACNLAAHVARTQAGRHGGVALIDLDLPFGTAAWSLGVLPPRSLADLDGHTSDEHLGSVVIPTDVGVHVLAAPTDPLAAEGISTEECVAALAFTARRCQLTVVDTGPYLTETTLAAIDGASAVIIPISGDVTAVPAARAALHTLTRLGFGHARVLLVATRMGAPHALTPTEWAEAVGAAPSVLLPESSDVALAARRGRILSHDWPDHPYVRGVGALADLVLPNATGAAVAPPPRHRWRRLAGPFTRSHPPAPPPDGQQQALIGRSAIG